MAAATGFDGRASAPGPTDPGPARVLVLGLGNPILGDDGVGWAVVRRVSATLAHDAAVSPWPAASGSNRAAGAAPGAGETIEIDYAALGGLALMERLVGADRAILVDAAHGTGDDPGTVRSRSLDEVPWRAASHLDSTHDVPLTVALETGRSLGARLPEAIRVVSVEALRVDRFGETLSPAVERAVPEAVRAVLEALATDGHAFAVAEPGATVPLESAG